MKRPERGYSDGPFSFFPSTPPSAGRQKRRAYGGIAIHLSPSFRRSRPCFRGHGLTIKRGAARVLTLAWLCQSSVGGTVKQWRRAVPINPNAREFDPVMFHT